MKKGIYFIFISLLCCLLPTTLFAKSDLMNLDVSCPVSDMKVSLYRVADENYKLTGVFSNYSVDLKQDVQGAANALENRILMDGIEAEAYATSDSSGKASFSGLESGIYLVVGKEVESNGVFYMPQVSLVSLSGDLSVDLKYETSNKASRIHVLKVWKNSSWVLSFPIINWISSMRRTSLLRYFSLNSVVVMLFLLRIASISSLVKVSELT